MRDLRVWGVRCSGGRPASSIPTSTNRGRRLRTSIRTITSSTLPGRVVDVEVAVLAKNDHLAGHNREWLAARGIVALNLMSSPGSGKTSLLERTIAELAATGRSRDRGRPGDAVDAERIRATGAPVVQINTGAGCHLDAAWWRGAWTELDPVAGLAAVHRERRQPGLPGAVRPRRGGPRS